MFFFETGISMLCERDRKSEQRECIEDLQETSIAGVNPVFNMFSGDLLIVSYS